MGERSAGTWAVAVVAGVLRRGQARLSRDGAGGGGLARSALNHAERYCVGGARLAEELGLDDARHLAVDKDRAARVPGFTFTSMARRVLVMSAWS